MGALSQLRKVFGTTPPPAIATAEETAGMTPARPFSPGGPLQPYNGYSTTPRALDFQTGYNIAARPRRNERVSFDALRGLIEAYDIAQICIWHRIDSIRSLKWTLVAKNGITGDVDNAIAVGMAALARPDRQLPFKSWLAKYLYDVLAYDAGTLYRIRNKAGRCIGLKIVDGTTIAPLLDDWGDTPETPAPAYVQFAQGLPWGWLTTDDLIYVPFRPVANSPYGRSPIETVLLNANTDLRFQAYFMGRFTDGNVPEGFAGAPEGWTPTQIEEFQTAWDALFFSDQAVKHQIKWVPNGTTFAWSNEKNFEDTFSLFLMRKTAAAYAITPADLGFTEDVNKASGDTQADVQFRIGDLPLIQHIEGVIDSFLQDDLGLPLEFQFDTGQEIEDRLATAQADQIYIQNGVVSPSYIAEKVYGLSEPDGVAIPRYIFSARGGPIPISALKAVAGPTDAESGAPLPGAALPHKPFTPVEGVVANPPPQAPALAVQLYPGDNPAAANAAAATATAVNIPTPVAPPAVGPTGVAKSETTGITETTGTYSTPLLTDPDDDNHPVAPAGDVDADGELVTKELAAFHKFAKSRQRQGKWRPFTFEHVDDVSAHRLNDAGRATVRKNAGQLVAAGLAVRAADTGRVLMLQRAFDPADPASGMWEFPGGHIEDGETPLTAAVREWQEETGCLLPVDTVAAAASGTASWDSGNGIYQGFTVDVPSEMAVPILERGQVINPDDPDGDVVEALAWWDTALLEGNPAIRDELAADMPLVLAALGGGADPKAPVTKAKREPSTRLPIHRYDARVAEHYAPRIAEAMSEAIPESLIRQAISAASDVVAKQVSDDAIARRDAAKQVLNGATINLDALRDAVRDVYGDAYLAGAHVAATGIGGQIVGALDEVAASVDWDNWVPGWASAANQAADGGLALLLEQADVTVKNIAGTTLDRLGNAIADGLGHGWNMDTVADSLAGIVDDPDRAYTIAQTETSRAATAASLDTYSQNGVTEVAWLVSDPCPICEENAAGSPYPLEAAPDLPAHPNCRCALAPVTS